MLSSPCGDMEPTWERLGNSHTFYTQTPDDAEELKVAMREIAAREWGDLADYAMEQDGEEKHVWFFPRGLLDSELIVRYASSK